MADGDRPPARARCRASAFRQAIGRSGRRAADLGDGALHADRRDGGRVRAGDAAPSPHAHPPRLGCGRDRSRRHRVANRRVANRRRRRRQPARHRSPSSMARPRRCFPISPPARCRSCCRSTPPPSCADRAAGVTGKRADDYLSGFHLSPFFLPGPAGYDAMFTAKASEMPELGISFSGPINVFVSGFALLYDLAEPVGMVERPVKELGAELPGIRHLFLENYARNTFERYGVPYVVSILCFDGGSRYRMISCRDAGKVAERFLKALHVAGGAPAPASEAPAPGTVARPEAAVGGLHLPCSGRHHRGHRLSRQRRARRLHGLFQDAFSAPGRAGLRQLPVVHEFGQLRQHRPGERGNGRPDPDLPVPGRRHDLAQGRSRRRQLCVSLAR